MLADCEAMAVDALTYLFNLWAERAKKMPLDNEREMTRHERTYHRELRRLYLELIPPSISCSTLVMITFFTLRQSISTLMGYAEGEEEDVSVVIMMIFSSANLLLDIVNVTCFARASSLFGLDVVRRENKAIYEAIAHEQTPLIVGDAETSEEVAEPSNGENIWSRVPVHKFHHHLDLVNLNMCSAWTVRDLNMDSIEPVASSHFIAILGCFHSTFARTRYVLCAFFGKQCGIFTHLHLEQLRSTAVLIAAAFSFLLPMDLSSSDSDAVAAVAVSVIILGSLLPLVQGLVLTALQIRHLNKNPPAEGITSTKPLDV